MDCADAAALADTHKGRHPARASCLHPITPPPTSCPASSSCTTSPGSNTIPELPTQILLDALKAVLAARRCRRPALLIGATRSCPCTPNGDLCQLPGADNSNHSASELPPSGRCIRSSARSSGMHGVISARGCWPSSRPSDRENKRIESKQTSSVKVIVRPDQMSATVIRLHPVIL